MSDYKKKLGLIKEDLKNLSLPELTALYEAIKLIEKPGFEPDLGNLKLYVWNEIKSRVDGWLEILK